MPIRNPLLATLALLLASCQSGVPPAAPSEPALKLSDLRPGAPTEVLEPPAQPGAGLAPITAQLLRLEYAPGADLEPAWSAAREAGSQPPVAALWQANGLRCALVDAARLKTVWDALPSPVGHDSSRITATDEFVPISPGRSVTGVIGLHLALAPGRETVERFDRGRFQFLAHFGGTGPGAVVELTPQLHFLRPSLLPRSPEQMQLDGRRFDALMLRIYLMPRQVLLIGVATEPVATPPAIDLHQPPLNPAPATQPAGPADTTARVITPDRLGAALLSAGPSDRPRQVLLLLGLEPRRP